MMAGLGSLQQKSPDLPGPFKLSLYYDPWDLNGFICQTPIADGYMALRRGRGWWGYRVGPGRPFFLGLNL